MNPQSAGGFNLLQGGTPYIQGSSPTNLGASSSSGLRVQPASTYNLNQSGTGGVPLGGASATSAGTLSGGGGGGAGGGGGGAVAAPAVDPSIYAYYDNLAGNINSQIGNLGSQQDVAGRNIDDAYQTQLNNLNTSKNVYQRDYNQGKDTNLQNETQNEGDIQFNTGQQTNALERLLGAAGFGNSGVADITVPYATGIVGAQQTHASQNAFGHNQQHLDQNWGDYLNGYNSTVGDLGHQKDVQHNQLQASIDQNKASLLSQLASISQQRAAATPGSTYANVTAASAPIQSQIGDLTNQINSLGQNYSNSVKAMSNPAYQAPALETYVPQQAATQINNPAAPAAAGAMGPFANLLLGAQDQKTANLAGQPAVA